MIYFLAMACALAAARSRPFDRAKCLALAFSTTSSSSLYVVPVCGEICANSWAVDALFGVDGSFFPQLVDIFPFAVYCSP